MDNEVFKKIEFFQDNRSGESKILNITNDDIVNDFLNKKISLDTLIEKEIFNTKEQKSLYK